MSPGQPAPEPGPPSSDASGTGHRSPLDRATRIGRRAGWDIAAARLLRPDGSPLIRDPRLHRQLRSSMDESADVQRLLAALRRRLLLETSGRWSHERLELLTSLLHRCVDNGWSWSAAPDEQEEVERQLEALRSGPAPALALDALAVARLALYRRPEEVFVTRPARAAFNALPPAVRSPLHRYLEERAA